MDDLQIVIDYLKKWIEYMQRTGKKPENIAEEYAKIANKLEIIKNKTQNDSPPSFDSTFVPSTPLEFINRTPPSQTAERQEVQVIGNENFFNRAYSLARSHPVISFIIIIVLVSILYVNFVSVTPPEPTSFLRNIYFK